MKNLATCNPTEFLSQTNRIRKSASKWLTDTDVMNIRQRKPEISNDMDKEEIEKAYRKQMAKNLTAALDAIMDEHPQETLELLALLCFVEPKNMNKYSIAEYLDALTELLNNKSVIGFFTSLISLENQLT